jgi:hypothetical protein
VGLGELDRGDVYLRVNERVPLSVGLDRHQLSGVIAVTETPRHQAASRGTGNERDKGRDAVDD